MQYKKMLVEKVEEENAFKAQQEQLRKKYNIQKDVVVVEKTNMGKFLIQKLGGLIRLIATIGLIGLALVGSAALVYPNSRDEIIAIFFDTLQQIHTFLGV
ncbi:MAG: hypothetical protein KH230_09785 [Enterocloster asparagiformis]|nr:hypothetical protein [Enterocloster asparagiformis]